MERDKIDRLSEQLRRFFSGPDAQSQAYAMIVSALAIDPELTVAQLYNRVAFGRGTGKSHCSGKREGELKFS